MHAASGVYSLFAVFVLFLHALFILWVVFGAFLTRFRPVLRWLHIASLVWGILTELLPWPCPLTLLENWLEAKAGVQPYEGGLSAPLPGQACLCRHLGNYFDGRRRSRVRSQSSLRGREFWIVRRQWHRA
jgi:hypothetical protein